MLRGPWRAEALALLEQRGFDGLVVIPEFRDHHFDERAPAVFGEPSSPSKVPRVSAESCNVLAWETRGIDGAAVALFWMPFNDELLGLTTRAEVSRELAHRGHRLALGMPPGAPTSSHVRYHAAGAKVQIHETLAATVDAALAICRSITCAACGSEHRDIMVGSGRRNQGSDCASSSFARNGRHLVLGCYGSSHYDGDLYEFTSPPPDAWLDADPVCDACIGKQIEVGALKQVPGNYYLGVDNPRHDPEWREGVSIRHVTHREVHSGGCETIGARCDGFDHARGDRLAAEGEASNCSACLALT